jgi:uncharacterized membrane-anchored protein
MIFEFDDIGYVKDADKESIDADDLIAQFRAGIEPGNEMRREQGLEELRQVDWSDPPFYDPETNNLTWGQSLTFDSGVSINYDIRLLGRNGVMSSTLVASPETYKGAVPSIKQLLTGYQFNEGARYAEWKPGDKVAAVGLAGLVGGGALAIGAKTGLLGKLGVLIAKGGKAIILLVIALFAGIASVFKKLFRGGRTSDADSYQR